MSAVTSEFGEVTPTVEHDSQIKRMLQRIQTPHSERMKLGDVQLSLYDALEADATLAAEATAEDLGNELAIPAGTSLTDRVRLVTAHRYVGQVNRALRFVAGSPGPVGNVPPSFEQLDDSRPVADCYGHTWLTSIGLDQAGVSHKIVWINGHAAIGVPYVADSKQAMWFYDPSNPKLSQDLVLGSAVTMGDFDDLDEKLAAQGRAAVFLRTGGFAVRDPGYNPDSNKYAWLRLNGKNVPEAARHRLIMNIFPAGQGRTMLERHLAFKRAMAMGDKQMAKVAMVDLDASYPDVDIRNEHEPNTVYGLLDDLCQTGDFTGAKEVLNAYFRSFQISNDTRVMRWRALCEALLSSRAAEAVGMVTLRHEFGQAPLHDIERVREIGKEALSGAMASVEEAIRRYWGANEFCRPGSFVTDHLSLLARQFQPSNGSL